MLGLLLKRHCPGSIAVAFTFAVPLVFGSALMVFSSALRLATFVFVIVVARFNAWDWFFFTFLKSFQTFQIYSLGLRLSLGLGFSFRG